MRKAWLLATAWVALGAACAWAGPATRPALEQLSRETAGLYHEISAGVVRVQLPAPRWLNEWAARENPIHKWNQLSPDVRQHLETDKPGRIGAVIVPPGAQQNDKANEPATAPATRPTGNAWGVTVLPGGQGFIFESRRPNGEGPLLLMGPRGLIEDRAEALLGGVFGGARGSFTPNNIGLVVDSDGHVLVPMFVEKEVMDRAQAVRVLVGSGRGAQMSRATFVGSDWQTNTTVLKLDQPLGAPVKLADRRPEDGSLVLMLAPNNGTGRLAIWTGAQQDAGVVVTMDAAVAGFARYGQFISAAACRPVVDQLVRTGVVRRAMLGVAVTEVGPDDPVRAEGSPLGNKPAMRVERVLPGSAADRGGLREGDLILSLAGEPVGDVESFRSAISNHQGKADLRILRGNAEISVTVELKPQ